MCEEQWNPEQASEWLRAGIANGWCSPVYCDTHEHPFLADSEWTARQAGDDPCIHSVRVFDSAEMSSEVLRDIWD